MIKKLIFFLPMVLSIFSLSSCGDTSTLDGGNQKEFITDAAPDEDSIAVSYVWLSPEITVELGKYFTPALCLKLDQYLYDFNNLQTELDFEKNYRVGRELFREMYDNLYEPSTPYLIELAEGQEYWSPMETIYDDLEIFKDQLGPIYITCAAECTNIEFLFYLPKLLEQAKKTTGTGDDEFIELVIFIDGNYGYAAYPGFKSWFHQTWDLGGASLLGEGILLEAITKSIDYRKKFKLFDAELALMRNDFSNDLTWGYAFQYTPEKVLEEFDAILALKYFNKEELVEIMKFYNRVKERNEELQFDCENQDCSYG